MRYRIPPYIDMTVDGRFVNMRRPSWPMRIAGVAIVIAVVAGLIGIAALALWIATLLLPIAILAACIAWIAYRFQSWRSRGTARAPRDLYSP